MQTDPSTHTYVMALAIAAILCLGTAIDSNISGPSDLRAAQDVASDTSTAQNMAMQAAECQRRFGPGVQVFVMDGQHTVCRPPPPPPATLAAKAGLQP